ncbi:hypothetical protein IE53DRAFT_363677 [Violaceomyces palustris]|uniref:Uncharacterized protein n=1 Tax=Violaceomyces palustris TaxID=1673888 RepID=A0ACD0NSC9_9BASI|nr:hypothetical protein IE53DRAFT_363677 [Violaceomyces palustris]
MRFDAVNDELNPFHDRQYRQISPDFEVLPSVERAERVLRKIDLQLCFIRALIQRNQDEQNQDEVEDVCTENMGWIMSYLILRSSPLAYKVKDINKPKLQKAFIMCLTHKVTNKEMRSAMEALEKVDEIIHIPENRGELLLRKVASEALRMGLKTSSDGKGQNMILYSQVRFYIFWSFRKLGYETPESLLASDSELNPLRGAYLQVKQRLKNVMAEMEAEKRKAALKKSKVEPHPKIERGKEKVEVVLVKKAGVEPKVEKKKDGKGKMGVEPKVNKKKDGKISTGVGTRKRNVASCKKKVSTSVKRLKGNARIEGKHPARPSAPLEKKGVKDLLVKGARRAFSFAIDMRNTSTTSPDEEEEKDGRGTRR